MTTKTRIAKVERAHAAKSPRGRIAIFHEHAETVRVDGVEMSRAEWDRTAKASDVLLVIRRASEAIKDGDE